MAMANSRKEVFEFYRSVIRITKNWKAKNVADTEIEINFIKNSARQMAKEFKQIQSSEQKTKRLMEMNKWLQISEHYGIPYEKPYHLPSGSMRKF